MLCMCGGFGPELDEPCRPSSTPKSNKNPYSSRGLDKFAMLSADLEARRRNIIAQMGYTDAALVRFVHTTQGLVPVVVKHRDGKHELLPNRNNNKNRAVSDQKPTVKDNPLLLQNKAHPAQKVKKSSSWSVKKESPWVVFEWGKPGCYGLALAFVFIMLCLLFSGRVFAIFCTSIWWYSVPIITGSSLNQRSVKKKKDHGRRLTKKNQ